MSKRVLPLAVVVLCGCALLTGETSSGRKLSATERYALASDTFTSVLKEVNNLIEQGVVTDQRTKDTVFYAAKNGDSALADAKKAFVDKDMSRFDYSINRVRDIIDTLGRIKMQNGK